MSEPLLKVTDLHAWYGESHILHGVNLHVNEGETICILGRNGMGKTTTLRTIMGILRKRTGQMRFAGQDLMTMPLHRTAHTGLGFVPEERGIFATLNVEENLMLPPKVAEGGMSVEEIFRLFPNLKERRNSPGTKLSGGEQQMLAMARILRTGAVLTELKSRGMTVVLVEQNFRFASRVADRFYLMDHGQMAMEFPVGDLEARREDLNQALGV